MVSDLHRNALTVQGRTNGQHRSVSVGPNLSTKDANHPLDSSQVSNLESHVVHTLMCTSSIHRGEFPPPPLPCFGRDELIEKIVGLAEKFTPIALIGAGGIGKTSIALALLHNDRIMKQFGENRRFIRCDKFPSTLPHFLRQLSDTIGAGIKNPESLAPLRPFLSSKEMLIILDNAESILDPRGTNSQEIYPVVEELSRFKTISLCITSRITTVPHLSKQPIIPTLSVEAACDIFYSIYNNNSQSDVINNLLRQLDFHALSIVLLATTASHNMWSHDRLAKEWDTHHTQVLQTDHSGSLATTIELSLTSPMFCNLGPYARDLLGVIAFFPQGINEDNLDWLFPTISNRQNIIDKFCALSLTYRSNNFITMLAPLQDHLCPKDPKSFPLLCAAKGCYFSRLSVVVNPGWPGFEETKWIVSEDVNIEYLLDVFTSTDANSGDVWDACASFMQHLLWHKPRLIILVPKVTGLPDDHASKLKCLYQLSQLFHAVGNLVEEKQLLVHTLKLWRKQGNKAQVAGTLDLLAEVNRLLGFYTEGMQQVKEALQIFKQLNDTKGQADCLRRLAKQYYKDKQFDAAEEAISKSISLLSGKDGQYRVCKGYCLLGNVCHSKGETKMAINHFETALGIASPDWHSQRFWIFYSLAELFFDQGRFEDAHTHIEHAKSHVFNDPYCLGRAMEKQAGFWRKEGKLREAKSEVLCAISEYEKVGAVKDIGGCKKLLKRVEKGMKELVISGKSGHIGKSLRVLFPIPVKPPFSVYSTK